MSNPSQNEPCHYQAAYMMTSPHSPPTVHIMNIVVLTYPGRTKAQKKHF